MAIPIKEIGVVIGTVIGKTGEAIAKDDGLRKSVLGEYTNGEPRSVADAMSGEIISPKDRLAITKRLEKNKKKKKKKNKKKKKYAKIDLGE